VYLYHYTATVIRNGYRCSVDATWECSMKIDTPERYSDARKNVIEKLLQEGYTIVCAIHSFAFLHENNK
jgi:hypothetical protein